MLYQVRMVEEQKDQEEVDHGLFFASLLGDITVVSQLLGPSSGYFHDGLHYTLVNFPR